MRDVAQQLQHEILEIADAKLLPESSLNLFKEKLAAYIEGLIDHDFEKLINILYRLDVNEYKFKTLISSYPPNEAGLIIADIIIERQQQKIQSRLQFRKSGEDISEDERW